MTREETKQLLAVIQAAYPNFHKDSYGVKKTDAEWKAIIDIWAIAMSDFEWGFIANGFKTLVQTNKFPPSPAEVIEVAKKSAMDWLEVTAHEKYGGVLPPETWLCINGRGIQYGQWSSERKTIHTSNTYRLAGGENE